MIVCVFIRYQVDLTGRPNQVYLSGLPNSEWLALDYGVCLIRLKYFQITLISVASAMLILTTPLDI
jgi:hypothetical protein